MNCVVKFTFQTEGIIFKFAKKIMHFVHDIVLWVCDSVSLPTLNAKQVLYQLCQGINELFWYIDSNKKNRYFLSVLFAGRRTSMGLKREFYCLGVHIFNLNEICKCNSEASQ